MNKISNKNKFLRGIKVMILVAVIVLSTAAVTTATSISSTSVNIEKKAESGMETLSDVLLQEGFEDGVMPPFGWSVDITNPNYTWEIVEAASEPELVHSGDYAAVVRWCHTSSQDEWLISPEVDLTPGYGSANVSFWANCWNTRPDCNVKVWICGDGFDDVIWDMNGDEDWPDAQYRLVDLDISNYIGNVTTIKWQYVGMRLYKDFALDDVLVYTGDAPIPPELEIGEITGGWAGLGNGGKISAEIKNVAGEEAEDATDVEWTISATGNGLFQKINESDNGTISVIAPGDVETVELVVGHHFGRINITVTAYEPHFDIFVSKSVDGFILIGFVIIPKG